MGAMAMTDVAVSAIPAGWYPDPLGGAQRRWWDSRSWTQYVQPVPATKRPKPAPATEAPATQKASQSDYVPMAMPTRASVSTKKSAPKVSATASVWMIALMPLIQLAAILVLIFLLADFGRFVQAATGFVFLLWTAVLATQDRRSLLAAGHSETASPWWLLLSPLAYLIARTVKVRNTTGRGAAPLWTYLALAIIPAIGVFGYLSTAGAMNLVLMAASH